MRIKTPAQPLVFRFQGVSALMLAVQRLYALRPCPHSRLALFAGQYYLAVGGGFGQRDRVLRAVGASGRRLGACPVLYAYLAEHGREISRNAVQELGRALFGGNG